MRVSQFEAREQFIHETTTITGLAVEAGCALQGDPGAAARACGPCARQARRLAGEDEGTEEGQVKVMCRSMRQLDGWASYCVWLKLFADFLSVPILSDNLAVSKFQCSIGKLPSIVMKNCKLTFVHIFYCCIFMCV